MITSIPVFLCTSSSPRTGGVMFIYCFGMKSISRERVLVYYKNIHLKLAKQCGVKSEGCKWPCQYYLTLKYKNVKSTPNLLNASFLKSRKLDSLADLFSFIISLLSFFLFHFYYVGFIKILLQWLFIWKVPIYFLLCINCADQKVRS